MLPTLEAGSIDAVVCDPPYHLTSTVERFGKPDAAPSRVPEGGSGVYARSSRGFMGQQWDGGDVAFRPETWREVLRVLKPGGYLLAFGSTRGYHRMTVAIEDAGFEIRDCFSWQYGSGFPKSLAVDKAIDRNGGEDISWFGSWFRAWREQNGVSVKQVALLFPSTQKYAGKEASGNPTGCVSNWEACRSVPTREQFNLLRDAFSLPFDTIEAVHRKVLVERTMVQGGGASLEIRMGERRDVQANITAPATDNARRWAGWGTALKPAWEPIVVARKPLQGTVAANVLKYGTGAINIDGCRVQCEPGDKGEWPITPRTSERGSMAGPMNPATTDQTVGRWPANVLLSCPPDCDGDTHEPGCPCAALDAQHDGASRFFSQLPIEDDDLVPFIYAAKAARSEREEGCDALPARTGAEAVEREEGSAGTKSPRAGAGRTADSVRNSHPTVKPVSVMRHLVRLCCREGGLVLDPFMGSGTTGIAAVKEGMRFVGIEMGEEYLAIARARIEAAQGGGFGKSAPPPLTVFRTAPGLPDGKPVAMMSSPFTPRKEAPVVYVKTIESNVKKGAKTELGRLTLIIGPNGSGKSSVVNGVELALTGRASDVVGRVEVAKGIDLLTLAPADADTLWAKATFSDGRDAEWRCERNMKTGGAREATHAIPSDVKVSFPVRSVREALAGSPATVRAWLVGRIGAGVSEAAIMRLLPEDLHAPYIDIAKPLFGYPAQILLDAREAAGKQARNAGSDAKAANALADQTGANLAGEPSEDEIEAVRQRVREAAVAASAAVKAPVGYHLAAMRADAEWKVNAYAELDAEVTRLTGANNHVVAQPNAEVARIRDALTRVLVFTATKDAADCLVCGNPIPHGAHGMMLQRAEALANAAKGDVAVLEARERLAHLQAALPEAQRVAEDAVRRFREGAAAMAEADARPATNPDPQGALRGAEEQVRTLEGARAAWANVRAAKARARDLFARQRLYTDLHAAIEDAIGGVLERARTDFVRKVQAYLPVEDDFDLVLTANGKDVCQFGFTRDGTLHTALSGAEWARLTLALAAAVTSTEEANVSILTPEDRAFDAETLAAVLRSMSNAPGQVILCSPVAPAGRAPKGWTVIDLTGPKSSRTKKADEPKKADGLGAVTSLPQGDGGEVGLDEFFGVTPGEAK